LPHLGVQDAAHHHQTIRFAICHGGGRRETRARARQGRVTSQVRAGLAGIGVAGVLLAAVAIRFTRGSAGGSGLASASTRGSRDSESSTTARDLAPSRQQPGSVAPIELLNPHADAGELVPGERIGLRAAPHNP